MYSFIFGCAGSSLLFRLFSSCGEQASYCVDFSHCRAGALGHADLVVVAHGLAAPRHFGLSWIRDRTMCPALACRFFTTESPRKLKNEILNSHPLPFCQLYLNKAVKSKILNFRLKNIHLIGLLIICNSLMSNHWRNVICEDTKMSDRL